MDPTRPTTGTYVPQRGMCRIYEQAEQKAHVCSSFYSEAFIGAPFLPPSLTPLLSFSSTTQVVLLQSGSRAPGGGLHGNLRLGALGLHPAAVSVARYIFPASPVFLAPSFPSSLDFPSHAPTS